MGEVVKVSASLMLISNRLLPYKPNSSVHIVTKRCSSMNRKVSLVLSMSVPNVEVVDEQRLPPWGDLAIEKGNDVGDEVAVLSEVSVKRKAVLNVDRVSFLEEVDEATLSNRILVLSRRNKSRGALELFTSMEKSGLVPSLHACNSLLSCLLRNGFVDNGMRVFGFMRRKKLTTGHSCSLILKAVSDDQGCDTAVEMFWDMEGEKEVRDGFDTIVYNTMMSVCGKVNNWREAERLWRHMKENGYDGTRVTYCLLVSIFVRCGEHELALDAYSEMTENRFEPGSDTMQAMIGACSKDGKWDLALSIFQNMLDSGMKPNTIAFNTLINSLGKAAQVELAFRVYNIMKSMGHSPDAYTWKAVLGALYRANRHDDAIKLFESIKKNHRSQLNSHLYNMALMSCSKLGLWEKSLQLLWQLEASESVSTASYNLVISACEIARKPDISLQVYEHMVDQKCTPDTFTHLSLIRSCIWGSYWEEVEEILNHAAPDASLYNAAIQGMSFQGKIELAKKLYTKMRQNNLQPDGKTRAVMLQNLRRPRKNQPSRYRTTSRSKLSTNRRY